MTADKLDRLHLFVSVCVCACKKLLLYIIQKRVATSQLNRHQLNSGWPATFVGAETIS